MAHIQKLKAHATGQIFAHINRDRATIDRYGNKDIDRTLTHLNYDIIHGDTQKLQQRLSEVKHQNREDLVTLCACVITLPGDLKDSSKEDQKKFFITATEFMKQKFGENNVIYATVHEDESTPHLHIGFVPVAKIERKYRSKAKKGQTYTEERISAKAIINKNMLKSFHTELDQYVEKYFQKCEILNGALSDRENISIKELKNFTAQKCEAINQEFNCKQEYLKKLKEQTGSVGWHCGFFVAMKPNTAQTLIDQSVAPSQMNAYIQNMERLNKDYLSSYSGEKYLKLEKNYKKMQKELHSQIKDLEDQNYNLKNQNQDLKQEINAYQSAINWVKKKIPQISDLVDIAIEKAKDLAKRYTGISNFEKYISDEIAKNQKRSFKR